MLISIAIITYNSGEFIIELLESSKAQTYKNIELVISDDASTDDTVAKISDWIEKNRSRFSDVKILSSTINVGLTKNANRAVKACKGSWVKLIAGDDVFEPNAIETFTNVVSIIDQSQIAVIFSGIACFSKQRGKFSIRPEEKEKNQLLESRDDILSVLIKYGNILPAPGALHNRNVFEKLGYFDEEIKMYEDFPYWIKCLKAGYSFDFTLISKQLVNYRVHENSICNNSNKKVLKEKLNSHILTIKYYILPSVRKNLYWTIEYNLRINEFNATMKYPPIKKVICAAVLITRKIINILNLNQNIN